MDKKLTAPLDPGIADRLLDLLSTDDDFRSMFRASPLDALRTIGYQSPEPSRMTACGQRMDAQPEAFADCKVEELAPKEAILGARSEIRAMLTRGLSQTTPQLDAALTPARLTLK